MSPKNRHAGPVKCNALLAGFAFQFRTLSKIAGFTKRAKILQDCLPALGPRNNVIHIQDAAKVRRGAGPACYAAKSISLQNFIP
jgi:hypothetical protein